MGAHATGWDGVWIGSREPWSHSFLGLGLCIIAGEGWIADTKLPTTSPPAAVASPHTLLCCRTGRQRRMLRHARGMDYLPPFGCHFHFCCIVNSCHSSTCLFLIHHPLTAGVALILLKPMTSSITRKQALLWLLIPCWAVHFTFKICDSWRPLMHRRRWLLLHQILLALQGRELNQQGWVPFPCWAMSVSRFLYNR